MYCACLKSALALLLVLLSCSTLCQGKLPSTIHIGAIFEEGASTQQAAFEFGIEQVNRDSSILKTIKLEPVIEYSSDSFAASRKGCRIIRNKDDASNSSGVGAIFTLLDQSSTDIIDTMCEMYTIPMLQTTMDSSTFRSEASNLMSRMKVNTFPDMSALSDALLDFVKAFNWKSVVILYQRNEGLSRLKSVLNSGFVQVGNREQKLDILIWEMVDIERTLKELRYNVPYRHIIVDIDTEQIPHFLDIALRMGILTSYHHYMFTSLDLEAINIGKFTWGGVNVTGYRMVDTKGAKSQRLLHDWVLNSVRPRKEASNMLLKNGSCSSIRSYLNMSCPCAASKVYCSQLTDELAINYLTLTDSILQLCKECKWLLMSQNALIIDSVYMYGKALDSYLTGMDEFSTKAMTCGSKGSDSLWSSGESIYNQMLSMTYQGLTGPLQIDSQGRRTQFELDLIEYDTDGKVQLVGHWTRESGLNITKSEERRLKEIRKDLGNKTLSVVVKEEHPFIFVKEYDLDGTKIPEDSKARYVGYAIDMMDEIGKILNITYKLYMSPDGSTGRQLPNGSWTGMIGELVNGNADLALGDLTITYERSSVIDFTKPFMNLGISILFKKPEPDPPKLFSFLEPLDNKIWMCMIGAYAFVSIFLFVVARFSPFEWKNPHPCNPESDLVENEFTLLNSFWFTIGSLMQQGCEIAPKASSTRIIAGVWWFFTLILISSYTANLAAFLTITRMSTPIKNADDLAKQTSIKYGSYFGGSTYSFFKHSKIPTYEKMWNFMSQNPDVFVNNSDLAIAKVKAGKYAYLMESVPLRYQLSKHCDLMEVGGELDSKGYGIGVPKDSPFRDSLSNAILSLSEQQVLLNLYNKWWNIDSSKCKLTEEAKTETAASQLGMANLGGVFIFLIGGLGLALFIAFIEFLINAFVNSRTDKQSLWSEIVEECTFAIKCWGPSEKPIRTHHNGTVAIEEDDLESMKALKSSETETAFLHS